jgi:predicted PurR-regulated permease PerM
MNGTQTSHSPRWSNTAKLVVGLTIAGIGAALLFRFQNILAPILFSFLLAYIIHPIASFFNKRFKIPWRLISVLIYLVLLLGILGLLTWGGISIVEQIQNLITFLQGLIGDLPGFFADLSAEPLKIGPFALDLSKFDLNTLWTQLQSVIQPILSQVGTLIGSIASGAASTVTWTIFILLISFFIMSESNGARTDMLNITIPNYQEDISRLGKQLSMIWNAFFRGQLIIFFITVTFYSILLGVLGVRYFFMLAIIAGLARFVPYVGPFVAWTTYGLVALFQVNHFNLLPLPYALIVVGSALLSDLVIDNFVSPRVLSNALEIHPAAVLITVLISGTLFGFIGVLLAAPVLASLKLIGTYIVRKLMDLDPWEGLKTFPKPEPLEKIFKRARKRFINLFNKSSTSKNDVPTKITENDQSENKSEEK